MKSNKYNGVSTRAIHGRQDQSFLSAVYPIYQTSTFGVEHSEDYADFFVNGDIESYVYTRVNNPTIRNVEERLADLEQTDDAVLFSSGMAAVTASILAVAQKGDLVVASRPVYGGTQHFLADIAPKFGIDVQFLENEELYNLEHYAPEAKVVFFETPANPTIMCIDIPAVVSAAKHIGAITIVDNTFASPINQLPTSFGVDMVVHSVTKYLGGHTDLIGGVVCTSAEYIGAVREQLIVFGGCTTPMNAFLLERSLKTLPMRMKLHNSNALTVAEFFEADSRIQQVYYPGLKSSPDFEIANHQMMGFSGMMAIDLIDDEAAKVFADSLQLGFNAVSLGGVETLITIPALSTHAGVSEEEKRIARVKASTVRISVGLEDVDDLILDFEQALSQIKTGMMA